MKMALGIKDPRVQAGVARALRLNRGETASKGSDSTTETEEEGQDEERGKAEKERWRIGGGTRTKNRTRMTAGSARLKQPPTGEPSAESSRETTPEVEKEVGTESGEERRVEGLKTAKVQLDEELRLKEIRIVDKEKKLREEREEAAQVLKEQRAVEEKLPKGVEKGAAETVDGGLDLEKGKNQQRGAKMKRETR
jgi:hypothetical protein